MKHFDRIEREFGQILTQARQLLQQVMRDRDDVAADLVRLYQVENLAGTCPDQLQLRLGASGGGAGRTASDSRTMGSGPPPASATRPAKTERWARGPPASAAAIVRTCS